MALFQVLRKFMANAQRITSEDKFDLSIHFINMVNDTSDVLNIKHVDEGQ